MPPPLLPTVRGGEHGIMPPRASPARLATPCVAPLLCPHPSPPLLPLATHLLPMQAPPCSSSCASTTPTRSCSSTSSSLPLKQSKRSTPRYTHHRLRPSLPNRAPPPPLLPPSPLPSPPSLPPPSLPPAPPPHVQEGIAWTPIDYFDNKRVCELLEGKKPTSVVELLDEESIMPQVS